MRDVYIIGVGTTNCGRFPDKGAHVLGSDAAWKAIQDSGIGFDYCISVKPREAEKASAT